jgi:peptidoglycan/LPS O-acetylase OafA/YrhL
MPALQSLRGIAAVWVVLYHLQVYLRVLNQPLLPVPGIRLGWLGVDLFFVLSGYLLGQPFIDGRSPRWGRFVADRFLRIAPPYYASFALTALGYAAFLPAAWIPELSLWSLLFVQVFVFRWFIAINPAFWSLAVELQFYLLLPFLARAFRGRWWPAALAACAAVAVAYRAVLYADGSAAALQLEGFTLPAFLAHFGAGLAIARIRLLSRPIGSGVRRLTFAAGLLLALVPAALAIPGAETRFSGLSWTADVLVRPIAAMGFALIVLATASGGWVAKALGWRPLEWLGAISYSLYLIHIPTQVLALRVVDATRDRWGWAIVAFLLSILAGWLLYRGVEAPAEVWRRRRKLRQRQAAASSRTPP